MMKRLRLGSTVIALLLAIGLFVLGGLVHPGFANSPWQSTFCASQHS